jgi:hypothetical protein
MACCARGFHIMSRWQATFVDSAPLSGEEVERHFDIPNPESSRWQWVRFESEDGDRWFGCFRQGQTSSHSKIVSPDDRFAYVLAGGVLYTIDAQEKALNAVDAAAQLTDVIAIPGTTKAACADFTRVIVTSPAGREWESPRIAWDGIRFIFATPDEIHGIAETAHGPQDEMSFRVDLRERIVEYAARTGRRAAE